ncbi:hypothetical protein SUNI508_14023 [Seiridium unicorne]|uniref:Uncharacterized protein n=1 Tax=Seiridium unicorne TaxID=138068 RepID=A0ABR2VAE8_9PEZI
MLLVFVGLVN